MKMVWQSDIKEPRPDDHKGYSPHPVFIALFSIAVVIAAVFYVRGWENEKQLKEFNFTANSYRQLLESRLKNIVTDLDFTKRYIQGSKFVDRMEFSSFIQDPINKSHEIRAVSWVPRISSAQRRSFETSDWMQGLEGRPIHDLAVSDQGQDNDPAPPRAIHFPVLYAEPAGKMDGLIGFDLASNTPVLALLEQARDEGIIVPITGIQLPHLMTGGSDKIKSSVNLIQPVYQTTGPLQTIKQRRDKHLGFLILQYDIGLALETILSNLEPSGFDIYIVDVEADDGNEIVYHHRSRLAGNKQALTYSELWEIPEFIHKSSLNVSGRQWKIMMVPLPQYFENHRQFQSWGVLVFGLFLCALFSYVMFVNQRRTDVIRKTVKSQTKELSITNAALQQEANKRRAQLRELDFQKFALDEHAIVSISDTKGNITYVNDKFCEASGYSRKELLGQNHRFMKSGEHSQAFFSDLWQTIASGKVWFGEIKNRNKNGDYYWVKSTIVPFLDEQGKPFQYVAIRTDITDRKEAEQNLQVISERFATSQTFANIGTWDWNIETNELYNSDPAALLFDHKTKTEKLTYENFLDTVHPGDRGQVSDAVKACLEENADYDIEFRILSPDGSVRWVRERGDVIRNENGKPVRMLGVVIDIDAMKKVEEELGRAKKEADKANQAKSEFLSSMSHELRTPMNSIMGFGQLLESNPKEPLTETQKKSIDHILRGGRHLLELINEVLNLAKIESGNIDLDNEHIFPKDVFRECLDLLRGTASERSITLSGKKESDTGIIVDRFRFKQVIINLLSNAIKYNRDGGSVTFGCQDKSDMVRIFVSDTGKGIPKDKIADLFNPFERLNAEQSDIEGTGIGLTISKRLVEAMGGTIGFESTVGEGSTFWVEFPKAKADQQNKSTTTMPIEKQQTEHTMHPDSTATLLYIEDNKQNIELMEMIVTRIEGLSLISAQAGKIGLEIAANRLPDIIISDINLPDIDGFEVLAHLKKNNKTKDIPVIGLSANAMPHDLVRAEKVGFLRYLTKPINIDDVITVIREITEKSDIKALTDNR